MVIKAVTIIFSVFLFLFVIELIRREKITFKYAVSWLILSASAVILAIFDELLVSLAKVFGFILPSNFVFFLIGMIFVLASLLFTVYLCQHNKKIEILAQKLGLLEKEIISIKDKKSQ